MKEKRYCKKKLFFPSRIEIMYHLYTSSVYSVTNLDIANIRKNLTKNKKKLNFLLLLLKNKFNKKIFII